MYITALDFGSSQLKALVAETRKNGFTILEVIKRPAFGMRKGDLISVEEALGGVAEILLKVKEHHKSAIKNIFASVGGQNVKHQYSKGIVAVSRADNEIYEDDIERVIKASQAINIGPNRMILHTITKEFIIDGTPAIADPLGMIGNRLEIQSLVIDAFKSSVNNLIKCVEAAGGRVTGLVYNPLAAARAVTTKAQRELGVVVVDLGAATTGMAAYEEGQLVAAAIFPVGAANITNDLAIGLKCPPKVAERIKFVCGAALAKSVPPKDRVDLRELDPSLTNAVSRRFIAEIIEVRLAEIFELVNNELKRVGKEARLPAGAVLAGGGAKIPGIVDLAKQELKLGAEIGTPASTEDSFTGFLPELDDPEFAAAAGLLLWAGESTPRTAAWEGNPKKWLSNFVGQFLP